jgi:hypothetical protein
VTTFLKPRAHHASLVFYEGTGHGDDREMWVCWCGWWTLNTVPRDEKYAKRHNKLPDAMVPMTWRERHVRRRELRNQRRPWRVRFDLAYEGGGSEWDGFYRTLFGARVSILWQRSALKSYGGSAVLHRNNPPEGTP